MKKNRLGLVGAICGCFAMFFIPLSSSSQSIISASSLWLTVCFPAFVALVFSITGITQNKNKMPIILCCAILPFLTATSTLVNTVTLIAKYNSSYASLLIRLIFIFLLATAFLAIVLIGFIFSAIADYKERKCSNLHKLQQYKSLLDAGIIDQKDFAQVKDQLLP